MPKGNPEPWFRPSRNTFYVTLGGKQVNLGTAEKSEAIRRWHELMAEPANGGPIADFEARDLFADFLEWCDQHCAPATYAWYRHYVRPFSRKIPAGLKAMDMRAFHVTRWLDGHSDWGDSSRRAAISCIKRAFLWGVGEGYLPYSPLAGLRKPAGRRRETILTAEQRSLIFESIADQQFKDVVIILQETGVRPLEIRQVESRHVDLDRGIWVFPPTEHKTGRKTGKPRVVYLTPAALEITRRRVAAYPEGPLFRNVRGNPWCRNAFRCRFLRLREKFAGKLPADLCAYHFRHTYATDALEQGIDVVTLAELMGHRDATMISRVYAHLEKRLDYLKGAAQRARREFQPAGPVMIVEGRRN